MVDAVADEAGGDVEQLVDGIGGADRGLEQLAELVEIDDDRGDAQLVLGGEVPVDERLADPGGPRDVADLGVIDAACVEHAAGGRQQLLLLLLTWHARRPPPCRHR